MSKDDNFSAGRYSQKDIDREKNDVRIAENIESIKKEVHSISEKLDKNYVSKDELATFKAELNPYILAVKSFLGMAVIAIVAGLLKIVIK